MRRILFAFVVMLTVLFVFGCGSSDEDSSGQKPEKASRTTKTVERTEPTPIETVQVAYETTVEEETARVVMDMKTFTEDAGSTTGDEVPMMFNISSEGVVDFGGQKSRMTMRMEPLGSMEVRQIGNLVYQKFPTEMRAEIPDVKPWIEMDLDAFYREQYGAGLSEMQASSSTDPTQQLEYLRNVGSVEKVGREEVRGVPTTHYRAVVDLEKEAELNGDPQVRKAYEEIRAMLGTSKLPLDVWLDDKDRIRRFVMEMTLEMDAPVDPSAPDGGATKKIRSQVYITQEISDFGVPVNVSPPPPGQTTGYKEFQRQVQQTQQQAAPAR